jgi:hypothetical protein
MLGEAVSHHRIVSKPDAGAALAAAACDSSPKHLFQPDILMDL